MVATVTLTIIDDADGGMHLVLTSEPEMPTLHMGQVDLDECTSAQTAGLAAMSFVKRAAIDGGFER